MAKYYVRETEQSTTWYKDEQMQILHREDGPAVEWVRGDKYWYKNGCCHREDGPAVELPCGDKEWWINGELHREHGPAIERSSGYKAWWLNGKVHREDGPAREYTDGSVEYALNGEYLTKEQWEAAVRPVEELTVVQIEQLLGKRIKVIK